MAGPFLVNVSVLWASAVQGAGPVRPVPKTGGGCPWAMMGVALPERPSQTGQNGRPAYLGLLGCRT